MNPIAHVYKSPTDTWIIEKLNTNYSGTVVYSINGNEENIPANQNIETKDKPISIIKVDSRQVISEYKDLARGGSLEVSVYNDTIFELKKHLVEVEDEDESKWGSLDSEFAYRKFVDTWKPQFIKERVETVYDIVYKELPVSQYSFITPMYQLGKEAISNPHCVYVCPVGTLLEAAAKKYGFERLNDKASYEETTGKKWAYDGSFQYIKINGHYPVAKKHESILYGTTDTYDKCIAKYDSHVKFIDELFAKEERLALNKGIDKNERGEILKSLNIIKDHLDKVEYKSKSYSEYRSAITSLNNLINRI